MTVRFTLPALADARQAKTWYDRQRPGLGDAFVEALDEVVARIDAHPPRRPQVVEDVRRVRMPHFPYALFFRAEPDEAVVIGVLHERRSPSVLQRRGLLLSSALTPPRGRLRC